jgi:hypothetical protein
MKTLLFALTPTGGLLAQSPFQVKVTGHGRPMIRIPGYSCPGEVWDQIVAHYQDRYQTHVLTLAGFAGVPRVPGPFLENAREAKHIRPQYGSCIVSYSCGPCLAAEG